MSLFVMAQNWLLYCRTFVGVVRSPAVERQTSDLRHARSAAKQHVALCHTGWGTELDSVVRAFTASCMLCLPQGRAGFGVERKLVLSADKMLMTSLPSSACIEMSQLPWAAW